MGRQISVDQSERTGHGAAVYHVRLLQCRAVRRLWRVPGHATSVQRWHRQWQQSHFHDAEQQHCRCERGDHATDQTQPEFVLWMKIWNAKTWYWEQGSGMHKKVRFIRNDQCIEKLENKMKHPVSKATKAENWGLQHQIPESFWVDHSV